MRSTLITASADGRSASGSASGSASRAADRSAGQAAACSPKLGRDAGSVGRGSRPQMCTGSRSLRYVPRRRGGHIRSRGGTRGTCREHTLLMHKRVRASVRGPDGLRTRTLRKCKCARPCRCDGRQAAGQRWDNEAVFRPRFQGQKCEGTVLVRLLPWLFWGRLAAPKRGPPGGPFFGQGAIDASETPPAHTATNPLKLTTPSLGEHNGTAGAVRLFTRCVRDSGTWSMKHLRSLL